MVKWLRSRAGTPASPDFPAVAAYLTRAVRDWILRLPNGYDWSKMQAEALARVLAAEADQTDQEPD